ncbi:iron-containing alcohol dehydrogenase [Metabacillus sp. GX 13764]|uniref:iron-containing alcohol dehydrogenase n=1 Tax=Metabacillus kandeliae TaxID=2900151 RepID=UPI001E2B57F1|nr:iron-containing alcohol dehydrogenase [Metabacillus kandeliae]MCD7036043.1 iron-containing alcohol dehydrogenase [Metabacillus kandeliae]
MKDFQYFLKTKVIYGENKSLELAEHIKAYSDRNKAVIVTDKSLVKLGFIAPIEAALQKEGIETKVYSDVKSNPDFQNIDEAAALIKSFGASAVIGIGGGSPLDTAKTASLVAGGDNGAGHYSLMANPFPEKKVLTIAIPTTSGTGAEVTSTTVYSDEKHRKLWAWDTDMLPEIAVLDPVLTAKLPNFLTAATSIDALVHALEAITGQSTNPVIEAVGLHAIRLVAENLPIAIEKNDDMDARGNLLIGSMLAGIAIEHGGTGIAHNIGHALSTVGGLHHGRAVAIALHHTYDWNLDSPRTAVFAKAARALGVTDQFEAETELAKAGAAACKKLIESLPITLEVSQDGLSENSLQDLTAACLAEENQPMRLNNCRYATDEELREFGEKILAFRAVTV